MIDPLSAKLDEYMTLLSARQRLVSANIANVDTPGYKTQDFNFDTELKSALLRSGKSAQPGAAPVASDVPGLRVKNDGNNVDLDREARLLAENGLRFSIASNLVRNQLKALRAAVTGGTGA